MNDAGRNSLLIGAGFLLGTVGLAALKSKPAHDLYVGAAVQGMRAQAGYRDIVEEARAQFDDIVAEADYRYSQERGDDAEVVEGETK